MRHLRSSIPLSTTAMREVATVLGGEENVEKIILSRSADSDTRKAAVNNFEKRICQNLTPI